MPASLKTSYQIGASGVLFKAQEVKQVPYPYPLVLDEQLRGWCAVVTGDC